VPIGIYARRWCPFDVGTSAPPVPFLCFEFCFFVLLETKHPSPSPTEVIDDPLKISQDCHEHDQSHRTTVEIPQSEIDKEKQKKKEKLIQKETIQTGSVRL
jgi:hypothetical protein